MTTTQYGPAYGLKAARLCYVSGSTIVKESLFYARTWAPNPQITTLSFEGEDTSQQIDQITRLEGVLTCDKQDMQAIARVFQKARLVAPVSGMEWGEWFGDQTEEAGALVGLEIDIAFKDESVSPNVSETIRYYYPRGTLKVIPPQNAGYGEKHVMALNFSFERTTTDILGAALSGVPTGGAYYLRGLVS